MNRKNSKPATRKPATNKPVTINHAAFALALALALLLVVLLFAAVQPASADPADWYNANWTYRKNITIDHDKVNGSSSLSNFPVLVNLTTDTDLAADAQNDGDDILFTSSDGTTKLAHEIEEFSGSTGKLIAWVNVTSLSHSADTTLYMYYNNSGCGSQQDATGVWDTNYLCVLHLDESGDGTEDEYKDATSNGNDARGNHVVTSEGDPYNGSAPDMTTSGKIGNAQSFTYANNDTILGKVHPIPDATSGKRTYEFWVNTDPSDETDQCFFSDNCANSYYMRLDVSSNGAIIQNGAGVAGMSTAAGTLTTGWHHIVYVVDGTSGSEIFVDGVSKATAGAGWHTDPFGGSTNLLRIGRTSSSSVTNRYWFGGDMDEWRVSDSVRSGDWIKTGYNNTVDATPGAGKFIKTLGDEENNWESYSDSGHTTVCNDFQSYASEHTVYMFGEGFTPSKGYRIIYWDGGGANRKTDDKSSDGDGNLSSLHTFAAGVDQAGTWYATVYDSQSYSPGSHDPADSHITVDDSFDVAESAIPEFSTVVAAIAVCMLCAVSYLAMRRRAGVR